MTSLSIFSRFGLLLVVLAASSCSLPARLNQPAGQSIQQRNIEATNAAIHVQTEIARPPSTSTPTSGPLVTTTPTVTAETTPSPTVQVKPAEQATPRPGMEFYVHEGIPNYVFQIDPETWEKDPSGKSANLVHRSITGCRIESVLGSGLGPPQRLFWQDLGRFRWSVMDYGSWAFAVPYSGAGLVESQNSFLRLAGYNRPTCRRSQENALANLITQREASGEETFTPYQSPTPRPPLEGFTCPDAPPARVRVGDTVSIITNGLWLRSEPRVDASTRMKQYMRYAPVMVQVIDGPVCEKYLYWQVELVELGEGGSSMQGWMAEGSGEEYYLEPVK